MRLNQDDELRPSRDFGIKWTSLSGQFKSQKTNKEIKFESVLERDFAAILEFDRSVIDYVHQPITIDYFHENRARKYTPDFIVKFITGPWLLEPDRQKPTTYLVEIKTDKELEQKYNEYESKFLAAQKYAQSHGWKFIVYTESIRSDYLNNIKFLLPYRYHSLDKELYNSVKHCLKFHNLTTPKTIWSQVDTWEQQARILFTIWQMVSRHLVNVDLSKPLTVDSEISWNGY